MAKTSTAITNDNRTKNSRRRYESPLRQAQTAKTRTRILKAGSYLAHRLNDWDWSKLTARAVAARAKVSERTVYRHFATEHELQEAILRRLEDEAGVGYETIKANELLAVTERIYSSFPKFAASSSAGRSISASAHRRQKALLRVLSEVDGQWSETERKMASAIIDIIWTPNFYEHLVTQWKLDSATAARAATWAIELLMQALRDDVRPRRQRKSQRTTRS
jgi:AcrR family transcriptional regulator